MKHFTAPVLGGLGLKKTCPAGCGLVPSQTGVSEDLPELRGVLRICSPGTAEAALWHGDPSGRTPAFLGSQGPLFSKQRKKRPLSTPVQSVSSTALECSP